MDVDDLQVIVEQAMISKTVPKVSVSEALEKAGLDESGPSNLHKDSSHDAGLENPVTDAAPTVVPVSSKEKEADDSEVIITETRQGVPPTQNVLAKIVDDKKQVMNQPFGSITEKNSIEELYNQSVVYTTEKHNIVIHLRRIYEIFYLFPALCY